VIAEVGAVVLALGAVAAAGVVLVALLATSVLDLVAPNQRHDEIAAATSEQNEALAERIGRTVRAQGR